jgi:glyoxylase-like metal-dependent hydrolase (beta-lactamase superfamily II)
MNESFPGASPETRRRAATLDPGSGTSDGRWLVHYRCFAVRLPDGTILLIDAGVGPAQAPAASWAPVPGELPLLLRDAGIDAAGVGAVVITHLHTDHVGWAIVDGRPYFPNARYVLQRAEAAAVESVSPQLAQAVLEPLETAGRLELIEGRARLGNGVTAVHTPGHTPGHQSVVIASGGHGVILTGDVLVHAVQLADPDVSYAHEFNSTVARQTRRRLLAAATVRGAVLGTAHLGVAFIEPD